MPTRGERHALVFLAAVAALGTAMQLRHSPTARPPSSGDTTALLRQIAAVDSVRGRSRSGRGRRGGAASPMPRGSAPAGLSPAAALVGTGHDTATVKSRVDLDQASNDAMIRLPGIGPAIAARIVADRAANGPFGCMAALRTVKGVGPALARRLDSLVTFSGPSRRNASPCARERMPRASRPRPDRSRSA
jgi:competence protein ComEA